MTIQYSFFESQDVKYFNVVKSELSQWSSIIPDAYDLDEQVWMPVIWLQLPLKLLITQLFAQGIAVLPSVSKDIVFQRFNKQIIHFLTAEFFLQSAVDIILKVSNNAVLYEAIADELNLTLIFEAWIFFIKVLANQLQTILRDFIDCI